MTRRKPYAPRLPEQIAVRTTREIQYKYYDLYLRLRRSGQLEFFAKHLTKEAMVNSLILACSEIEEDRLIRWLRTYVEEFERLTRTDLEDHESGLDTSHIARRKPRQQSKSQHQSRPTKRKPKPKPRPQQPPPDPPADHYE